MNSFKIKLFLWGRHVTGNFDPEDNFYELTPRVFSLSLQVKVTEHKKYLQTEKERFTNRWGPGSRAWHAFGSSGGCWATGGIQDGSGCLVWTWSRVTCDVSRMMFPHSASLILLSLTEHVFANILRLSQNVSAGHIQMIFSPTPGRLMMICLSLTQIITICCRFSRKMFAFHTKISRDSGQVGKLDLKD